MGSGCWRLRLHGRGLLGEGPMLDLHAKARPRVILGGYGCLNRDFSPAYPGITLCPVPSCWFWTNCRSCPDGYCKEQRLPGWRLEQPGCDPLFMDAPSRITLHTRPLRDADCAGATRLSVWVRRVWYLRDYSLYPGDGSGALMVKTWRDSQQGFGRGEVLVPGVAHWELQVVSVSEGVRCHRNLLKAVMCPSGIGAPLSGWISV